MTGTHHGSLGLIISKLSGHFYEETPTFGVSRMIVTLKLKFYTFFDNLKASNSNVGHS